MLRIRLIGEMALEIDGSPGPPPPSRRARSLLAWLALHPGSHARAEVAARFWPDMLDSSARTNLRSALLALRSELGPAGARYLAATRESVGIPRDGDVWVDALEFEARLAGGELAAALELGDGELLPGLDDEWVYAARDVHRDRLGECLTQLAAAAEDDGDLAAAVRWTRRLVALDPLSEEAHRQLIRRLAESGDRPAALAAFAKLRDRLASELRVPPALETRRLAEAIRAEPGAAAAAPPPAPPPPPRLTPRSDSRFVGREDSLAFLRTAWSAARGGERRIVLLAGEPGIGKTRLAAELAALAHADGATVLYGRCHPEAVTPYEPFTEALRDYLVSWPPSEAGRLLEGQAGELVRILPALTERLPADAPPLGGDPHGERYRLFEAVASVLATAATATGSVLVLDDLHWADRPTLLLLQHIMRAPEPAHLLVVGTYRDAGLEAAHPLAQTLAELRRERLAEAIALEGLPRDELAELIAVLTGGAVPETFTQAISAETEGNPYFVEEVLRHLAEAGALAGREPLSARTLEQTGVPAGVKDVIGRRLAALGEGANRVLAIAAVAGREFDWEVLEQCAGLEEEELLGSLEEAVAAKLIAEEPGEAGRFAFTHALVRETLYDELSAARRARLHKRIGEALEDIHRAELEPHLADLAYHFTRAAPTGDDVDRAAGYAARAAEQALRLIAYEEAATHYERALRCLEQRRPVDESVRCELLIGLGDAQQRAGWLAESRGTFELAAGVARDLDDHERLARAALGAGGGEDRLPSPYRVDEALVALLSEAAEPDAGDGDPGLRARLLARLALELYWSEPRREHRETLSHEALELARRSGDRAALAYCLFARRFAAWGPDNLEQRLDSDAEMVQLARGSGNDDLALQASWARICDLLELGYLEEADTELDSYEQLARKRRAPYHMFGAACWRAMRAIIDGRLEEADGLAQDAFEFGQQVLPHRFLPAHALATQRYIIRRDQGRLGEHVETIQGLADRFQDHPAWRPGLAALYAELGRAAEARTQFDAVATNEFADLPRDFLWLSETVWLGEACAFLGDQRRAGTLYELLLPYAGKYAWAGYTNVPVGPTSRVLGLLATVMARWEDAHRHFEDALELTDRIGAQPNRARTHKDYAAMLLARGEPGDPEKALDVLDVARGAAEELGMKRLVEDAYALRTEAAGASS